MITVGKRAGAEKDIPAVCPFDGSERVDQEARSQGTSPSKEDQMNNAAREDSDPIRSFVPKQSDHPFRSNPITLAWRLRSSGVR
jgi:hypothetical protein